MINTGPATQIRLNFQANDAIIRNIQTNGLSLAWLPGFHDLGRPGR